MKKAALFLLLFCFCYVAEATTGFEKKKLELRVQLGHTDAVTSAQFSPDGKYILTASQDNTAKLWDVENGKLIRTIEIKIKRAIFSPDGKYILTASWDKTAKIWDVESGTLVRSLAGHTSWITTAVFSPDGKYILTASWDKTAKIWDVESGTLVRSLAGHTDRVRGAIFSPNGKNILTLSDYLVCIWDAYSGNLIDTIYERRNYITEAFYNPDGRIILTKSSNKICLWDPITCKLINSTEGNTNLFNCAVFSPNGKFILTVLNKNSAGLWDTETCKLIHILEGHSDYVYKAIFSPNGKFILTASRDKTAKLWNVESGKLIRTLEEHTDYVYSALFSLNGKFILTASRDKTAKLWDVENGSMIRTFEGHTAYVLSAVFSQDGKFIVTASGGNTICLWEIESGKQLHSFQGHNILENNTIYNSEKRTILTVDTSNVYLWDIKSGKRLQIFEGHKGYVNIAIFSPGEKYILTVGAYDSTISIWDAEKYIPLYILKGDFGWFDSAEFSPDGKQLLSISSNISSYKELKLWLLEEKNSFKAKKEIYNLRKVLFSPDGKYIFAIGQYESMLLDAKSFETIYIEYNYFENAIFSPNGKYIFTSIHNKDNVLSPMIAQLRSSENGKLIHNLEGHNSWIQNTVFSPDGKLILTSSDGIFRIWEVENGNLIRTFFNEYSSTILSTIFSTDGKYILTTSSDSKIKIWSVETGKELITIIPVGETDWLHITPDGRFDYSSDFALSQLHYVSGLEVITLEQFNSKRFYEPGLYEKVMNGDKSDLRDMQSLDSLWLYPEVELANFDHNLELDFTLKNRGGGFGRVEFLIDDKIISTDLLFNRNFHKNIYSNGKEIENIFDISDNLGVNNTAIKEIRVKTSIPDEYFIPGKENKISIRAWDYEEIIRSREQVVYYKPTGKLPDSSEVKIFVVSIGVSNYNSKEENRELAVKSKSTEGIFVNLPYSDKDAKDIAKTLEIGASGIFLEENTKIWTLTTDGNVQPTKENILKAFEEIKKEARPFDILVIYYSGHGTTSAADKLFYLVPKGMRTSEDFKDAGIVKKFAISENELLELVQEIKSNKVVLILDACESGSVADINLAYKKDISNSRKKTIEIIRENSGMVILCGSSANAPSFMASRYRQSLLTYGLLSGIRGGKLGANNEIEILPLFSYTRDLVNKLSKDLDLKQEPQIAGRNDVVIGRVPKQRQNEIPLQNEVPVISKIEIRNVEPPFEDLAEIESNFKNILIEKSTYGDRLDFLFLENNNFPKSYLIRGEYKQEGNDINIKIYVYLKEEPKNFFELIQTIPADKTAESLDSFIELVIKRVFKKFNEDRKKEKN